MKTFWSLCFSLLVFTAFATSVPPRSLAQLVADSEHIIIAKITLVDMVDEKGQQVTNPTARTGPGLSHTIRLNATVQTNGVLLSNSKHMPQTLVIPLWPWWHHTLGQIKDIEEGQTRILLLKGSDFNLAYPASCSRPISERSQIEELIKSKAASAKPAQPAVP
jgi:hypothetical protein